MLRSVSDGWRSDQENYVTVRRWRHSFESWENSMEILRKSEDATSSELVLAYNLRFSEVWKRLRFTSSNSTTFGTLEHNYYTNNALCGGDDLRPFWPKIIAGYEPNVSGRCWCVMVRNNWSIVFCQLWISIEEMVYCTTGISIRMKRYIEEMVYSYDWDFDRRKCLFHVLWKSIEEMVYCTSGISIEHYGLVLWISIEELCRAFFQVWRMLTK